MKRALSALRLPVIVAAVLSLYPGRVIAGHQAVAREPSGLSGEARLRHLAAELFVRDVYARLMRYQLASVEMEETPATKTPNRYLRIAVSDFQSVDATLPPPSTNSAVRTLLTTRRTVCHRSDPCHVYYEVEWAHSAATSSLDLLDVSPSGRHTAYSVSIMYKGVSHRYRASVRQVHASSHAAMEILDPVIPSINEIAAQHSPVPKRPWETYVRSGRYASAVRETVAIQAGKKPQGSPLPIGYLPGDGEAVATTLSMPVPCSIGECSGAPDGQPCSDDGNPSCDIDTCRSGTCNHEPVAAVSACPGTLGWDPSGLTAGASAALTCLENLVTAAGGQVTQYSSAYRPQSYQDHLYQIAETVRKLRYWMELECAEIRLTALNEKQTHGLGDIVAQHSNHTDGVAFDVTVAVPAGYALDQQANNVCHLVRDVPSEAWHWHYTGQ